MSTSPSADPRPIAGPSPDIVATAWRSGASAWWSGQLFVVLGGWATEVDDAAVAPLLGRHAHRSAWHHELWLARLPTLVEFSEVELTAPPAPAFVGVVERLGDVSTSFERLAGVYHCVLPRLVDAQTGWRRSVDARVDGPTARVLDLVLADQRIALDEGRQLLDEYAPSGDDSSTASDLGQPLATGTTSTEGDTDQRAAVHVARIERLLAEAGDLLGDDYGHGRGTPTGPHD